MGGGGAKKYTPSQKGGGGGGVQGGVYIEFRLKGGGGGECAHPLDSALRYHSFGWPRKLNNSMIQLLLLNNKVHLYP